MCFGILFFGRSTPIEEKSCHHGKSRCVDYIFSQVELLDTFRRVFCVTPSMWLDLCSCTGSGAVAALKAGIASVSVEWDDKLCNLIAHRLSEYIRNRNAPKKVISAKQTAILRTLAVDEVFKTVIQTGQLPKLFLHLERTFSKLGVTAGTLDDFVDHFAKWQNEDGNEVPATFLHGEVPGNAF